MAGRPLIYDDPGALQTAVDAYFASTMRPTLSGLALHIGMDRTSLYNYKERDGFFDIIKNAQARVEAIYEERLVWDGQMSVIFPLKNMGWSDKTQTELTGKDGGPVSGEVTLKIVRGSNTETE
jgi:hypothetical protein